MDQGLGFGIRDLGFGRGPCVRGGKCGESIIRTWSSVFIAVQFESPPYHTTKAKRSGIIIGDYIPFSTTNHQ